MFQLTWPTALEIVLRTLVIYIIILVGLRLAGKREIGQMNAFDLVVLLLIANAVQNAMVGPDTSLIGGILAAVVLLITNAIVARLRLRFPVLRRWAEGSPTLLVLHGRILRKHMIQEGIDEDSLMASIREHGLSDLSEVDIAVLEIDGSISVISVDNNAKNHAMKNG
jgi:uncharacterized membrane protein YcaP (DUF421 family)